MALNNYFKYNLLSYIIYFFYHTEKLFYIYNNFTISKDYKGDYDVVNIY